MKAVLTLDNGEKVVADIYPLQGNKHKPRFHDEYERWFVEEFNKAQPRAAHKVVKAHILRN